MNKISLALCITRLLTANVTYSKLKEVKQLSLIKNSLQCELRGLITFRITATWFAISWFVTDKKINRFRIALK